jgi:hypothetical protein
MVLSGGRRLIWKMTGFNRTEIFALVAAIGGVAAAIFSGWQAWIADDQLTLQYPPIIRTTNVAISPKGQIGRSVILKPGSELEGSAWIVNTGSEITNITGLKCVTYWKAGTLPMYRPIDRPDKFTKQCQTFTPEGWKRRGVMNPGAIAHWDYETIVPNEYTSAMFFYVMGSVLHFDRLGVRHLTLFARKYEPVEERFIAVENNRDYEGYE